MAWSHCRCCTCDSSLIQLLRTIYRETHDRSAKKTTAFRTDPVCSSVGVYLSCHSHSLLLNFWTWSCLTLRFANKTLFLSHTCSTNPSKQGYRQNPHNKRYDKVNHLRFYRAMPFSAKRGLAIACRPFVRLSVCDVGDLWSHRLEILETIVRAISPTHSLFAAKRRSTYSQGNMEKFWGD